MSDVVPLASELRLVVHRLTRRLRQEIPSDGLTLTQLSALNVIWREVTLTAGDLAIKEQVRPPSITRVPHASVVLAFARNEQRLWQAIDTRNLIGQEQGMLMSKYVLTADRAFAVLRRYSQTQAIRGSTKIHSRDMTVGLVHWTCTCAARRRGRPAGWNWPP